VLTNTVILCRLQYVISTVYFYLSSICSYTFLIQFSRRNIQVFRNVTPFWPVYSYGGFGGNRSLHLQGPATLPLQMEPLISSAMSVNRLSLKRTTLRNSKTSICIYQSTRQHTAEDLNLHFYLCNNLECCPCHRTRAGWLFLSFIILISYSFPLKIFANWSIQNSKQNTLQYSNSPYDTCNTSRFISFRRILLPLCVPYYRYLPLCTFFHLPISWFNIGHGLINFLGIGINFIPQRLAAS